LLQQLQDKDQMILQQEFGGINKKIFVFYIFEKEGLISLFFFIFI
jgi:hypothetical protein